MFTVPGDGAIDYGDVMRALAAIGYSGWIIIEAEQDPKVAASRHYGAVGLRTLDRMAARAGLVRVAASTPSSNRTPLPAQDHSLTRSEERRAGQECPRPG